MPASKCIHLMHLPQTCTVLTVLLAPVCHRLDKHCDRPPEQLPCSAWHSKRTRAPLPTWIGSMTEWRAAAHQGSGSNNRINNNSKSQQRPTWIWSMMEWRAPAAAASRRCCAANSPSTTAAAARRLIPSFSTSSSWRSAKRRAVGGSNEARSSGSSRACSCGQQHLGVLASGRTWQW